MGFNVTIDGFGVITNPSSFKVALEAFLDLEWILEACKNKDGASSSAIRVACDGFLIASVNVSGLACKKIFSTGASTVGDGRGETSGMLNVTF